MVNKTLKTRIVMKTNIKLILFAVFALLSCSQETHSPDLTEVQSLDVKELAFDIIENGYLDFINNQYELKITKNEALDLGFSSEGYDYLFNSAEQINKSIRREMDVVNNYSVYEDKSNSLNVINQINQMINNGHIIINDYELYDVVISLSEAIRLGYTEEAFETAKQRIKDGSISDCPYIIQPGYNTRRSDEIITKSDYLQEITGGVLIVEWPYSSVTEYFRLPNDSYSMNALGVMFCDNGSMGYHTIKTITDVGTRELSAYQGGIFYVPVLMCTGYLGVYYTTTSTDGGYCYYHKSYQAGLI